MTDPQPLSDERLAEIAATSPHYEGPWTYDLDDDGLDWVVLYPSNTPLAGRVATVPDYGEYLAEFIAGARTAVPELLAEVKRLRAVEAAAYGFADEMGDYCSPHGVAADYAQRLRDRLNDAKGK